ncbi:hypothetical protein BDN72DRAFT_912000 [Pluteus cervinus]|uniref:Uncharacterized protein n=1 Tax=Pluteus cervinus TaxID=181527 RepID=A0ACD3AQK9_9AGAR|nr:hypothetical protein BDN72DRAFT_912000 [Pluteus cervinus]
MTNSQKVFTDKTNEFRKFLAATMPRISRTPKGWMLESKLSAEKYWAFLASCSRKWMGELEAEDLELGITLRYEGFEERSVMRNAYRSATWLGSLFKRVRPFWKVVPICMGHSALDSSVRRQCRVDIRVHKSPPPLRLLPRLGIIYHTRDIRRSK